MTRDLDTRALVAICREIGGHVPMWTQGAGGNVSVKHRGDDEILWIKSSGARLDQVGAGLDTDGIAGLALLAFTEGLENVEGAADPERSYSELLAACTIQEERLGRPSMESGFHALLVAPWVLHFHSLPALLMVHQARRDERRFSGWWQGASALRYRIVQAERPGWSLADRIRGKPGADAYLLANHGVILQGEDPSEALARWSEIEHRFLAEWGYRQLLEWADLPPEVLHEKLEHAAPLRIFFPDTAVFLDRLQEVLVPAGERNREQLWRLRPHSWRASGHRERDASELWLAQLILLSVCPDLAELPESIAATVASMPLELLRRGLPGRTP